MPLHEDPTLSCLKFEAFECELKQEEFPGPCSDEVLYFNFLDDQQINQDEDSILIDDEEELVPPTKQKDRPLSKKFGKEVTPNKSLNKVKRKVDQDLSPNKNIKNDPILKSKRIENSTRNDILEKENKTLFVLVTQNQFKNSEPATAASVENSVSKQESQNKELESVSSLNQNNVCQINDIQEIRQEITSPVQLTAKTKRVSTPKKEHKKTAKTSKHQKRTKVNQQEPAIVMEQSTEKNSKDADQLSNNEIDVTILDQVLEADQNETNYVNSKLIKTKSTEKAISQNKEQEKNEELEIELEIVNSEPNTPKNVENKTPRFRKNKLPEIEINKNLKQTRSQQSEVVIVEIDSDTEQDNCKRKLRKRKIVEKESKHTQIEQSELSSVKSKLTNRINTDINKNISHQSELTVLEPENPIRKAIAKLNLIHCHIIRKANPQNSELSQVQQIILEDKPSKEDDATSNLKSKGAEERYKQTTNFKSVQDQQCEVIILEEDKQNEDTQHQEDEVTIVEEVTQNVDNGKFKSRKRKVAKKDSYTCLRESTNQNVTAEFPGNTSSEPNIEIKANNSQLIIAIESNLNRIKNTRNQNGKTKKIKASSLKQSRTLLTDSEKTPNDQSSDQLLKMPLSEDQNESGTQLYHSNRSKKSRKAIFDTEKERRNILNPNFQKDLSAIDKVEININFGQTEKSNNNCLDNYLDDLDEEIAEVVQKQLSEEIISQLVSENDQDVNKNAHVNSIRKSKSLSPNRHKRLEKDQGKSKNLSPKSHEEQAGSTELYLENEHSYSKQNKDPGDVEVEKQPEKMKKVKKCRSKRCKRLNQKAQLLGIEKHPKRRKNFKINVDQAITSMQDFMSSYLKRNTALEKEDIIALKSLQQQSQAITANQSSSKGDLQDIDTQHKSDTKRTNSKRTLRKDQNNSKSAKTNLCFKQSKTCEKRRERVIDKEENQALKMNSAFLDKKRSKPKKGKMNGEVVSEVSENSKNKGPNSRIQENPKELFVNTVHLKRRGRQKKGEPDEIIDISQDEDGVELHTAFEEGKVEESGQTLELILQQMIKEVQCRERSVKKVVFNKIRKNQEKSSEEFKEKPQQIEATVVTRNLRSSLKRNEESQQRNTSVHKEDGIKLKESKKGRDDKISKSKKVKLEIAKCQPLDKDQGKNITKTGEKRKAQKVKGTSVTLKHTRKNKNGGLIKSRKKGKIEIQPAKCKEVKDEIITKSEEVSLKKENSQASNKRQSKTVTSVKQTKKLQNKKTIENTMKLIKFKEEKDDVTLKSKEIKIKTENREKGISFRKRCQNDAPLKQNKKSQRKNIKDEPQEMKPIKFKEEKMIIKSEKANLETGKGLSLRETRSKSNTTFNGGKKNQENNKGQKTKSIKIKEEKNVVMLKCKKIKSEAKEKLPLSKRRSKNDTTFKQSKKSQPKNSKSQENKTKPIEFKEAKDGIIPKSEKVKLETINKPCLHKKRGKNYTTSKKIQQRLIKNLKNDIKPIQFTEGKIEIEPEFKVKLEIEKDKSLRKKQSRNIAKSDQVSRNIHKVENIPALRKCTTLKYQEKNGIKPIDIFEFKEEDLSFKRPKDEYDSENDAMYKFLKRIRLSSSKKDLNDHHKLHKNTNGLYKCDFCAFECKQKYNIRRHILAVHKDNGKTYLKCKICDYQATSLSDKKNHYVRHKTTNNNFKCYLCPYQAKLAFNVRRHLQTHDIKGRQLLSCTLCGFQANSRNDMAAHNKLHMNNSKYFKCQNCPFETIIKSRLNKHVKLVHEMKGWQKLTCVLCHFQAKTYKELKDHDKIVHKKIDGIYKCCSCVYETNNKRKLLEHTKHIHDKHGQSKLLCILCNFQGKDRKEFFKHNAKEHRSANGTFKCSFCPFESPTKHLVRAHLQSIHENNGVSKLICRVCTYHAVSNNDLRIHLEFHVGENIPYLNCDLCSYKTLRKQNLNAHLSRHKKSVQL